MICQIKLAVKKAATLLRVDVESLKQALSWWSISWAVREAGLSEMIETLRILEPDLSQQESHQSAYNGYWEMNRRALHAFQCSLMLQALQAEHESKITVCDIGDSAGTHMRYLRELLKGRLELETISVNLDPRAIEKIRARGYKAILCRAEELDMHDVPVDLFTSFQTVEHLHNPAIFLRRLAKRSSCSQMIITVPFLRRSRVGLHHVRFRSLNCRRAEQEHIFELSPDDWALLFLHSGWEIVTDQIYYQYPRKIPIVSWMLRLFWRETDYEGFWGVVLKRNTDISDLYLDWEE